MQPADRDLCRKDKACSERSLAQHATGVTTPNKIAVLGGPGLTQSVLLPIIHHCAGGWWRMLCYDDAGYQVKNHVGASQLAATPKSKISQGRRNRRRAHDALKLKSLVECPQCKAKKLPHRVCLSCGHYNGVQVLEV